MTPGSCFCGSIRFEIYAFATDIYKCHCSRCRKQFGGASGAAAMAPASGFRWTQGKELRNSYQPPGSQYKTWFCSNCGSTLFWRSPGATGISVSANALQDDHGLKLKSHIWVEDKPDWYEFADECPRLTSSEFAEQK